jgi:prepilin-type N-terminal cleavage/methylation domain-containing protein
MRSSPCTPAAFTLVELLVVITIVVVLLALLTPALDQAIYQAELSVCGANHRTVITGSQTYAMDFKRMYPYRSACHDDYADYQPHFIKNNQMAAAGLGVTAPTPVTYGGHDDRPVFRGYIPLDALNDPLLKPIDLDNALDETWMVVPKILVVGWKYMWGAGMVKYGDVLRFSSDDGETFHSFNVLVADFEFTWQPNEGTQSAHPDKRGVLGQVHRQNSVLAPGVWADSVSIWGAQWTWSGPNKRGLLDRNIGYQDGSVRRFIDLDVPPAANPNDPGDHPMRALPPTDRAGPGDVFVGAQWIPPN